MIGNWQRISSLCVRAGSDLAVLSPRPRTNADSARTQRSSCSARSVSGFHQRCAFVPAFLRSFPAFSGLIGLPLPARESRVSRLTTKAAFSEAKPQKARSCDDRHRASVARCPAREKPFFWLFTTHNAIQALSCFQSMKPRGAIIRVVQSGGGAVTTSAGRTRPSVAEGAKTSDVALFACALTNEWLDFPRSVMKRERKGTSAHRKEQHCASYIQCLLRHSA